MRVILKKYGIFYGTGAVLALWLKYRYGHGTCGELLWLLAPAAVWAGFLGGIPFSYEPGIGYINHSARFIIAPSCSGVQYLIIVFGMLLFTFVHRTGTRRRAACFTALCLAGAYGYTIFINGIRIVLAVRVPVWLRLAGLLPGGLSPQRLHTVIGAAVYFAGLLLLYQAADRMPEGPDAAGGRPAGSFRYAAPVFWYLFVVLGVPFLNRALQKDREGYLGYAAVTVCVCVSVLVIWLPASAYLKERLFLRGRCAILFSQKEKTGNGE